LRQRFGLELRQRLRNGFRLGLRQRLRQRFGFELRQRFRLRLCRGGGFFRGKNVKGEVYGFGGKIFGDRGLAFEEGDFPFEGFNPAG
jgi:hypothetical protein